MRDWLYSARKNKGLTHEDISKIVGISRQYYGMIENGVKTPSVSIAKKIGEVLEVNWVIFFETNK